MSYIVEQKIKGRIYLYKVESYWDKNKKQARQKRTYIGPKERRYKKNISFENKGLVSKKYGNTFVADFLSNKLNLSKILKKIFPGYYQDILALAYFQMMEFSPLYLFHYWREEQYLDSKKLHSTTISELCENIGKLEKQCNDFFKKWISTIKPVESIYFDITSISSYSKNIDFIEWGYNRDKENLPQLNLGVTFCQNHSLPLFYIQYPGSIVDVKTLKNCLKYMHSFDIKDYLFILDKGFFSKANILEMSENNSQIYFIQPISFSVKKAKDIVLKYKKKIQQPSNAFKYGEDILYHQLTSIKFDEVTVDVHLYFNEKSEIEQKQNFLSKLIDVEQTFLRKKFKTLKECLNYKNSNIPEKYKQFFKWNKETLMMERNSNAINTYTSKLGMFLIATNKKGLSKEDVLSHYRKRDSVEKIFKVSKNEMGGKRLRTHGKYTTNGRFFIQFISLILHSEVSKTMRNTKLFKSYSVKELFAELGKIRISEINKKELFLSEISKKQRRILKAFGIKEDDLHSY